MSDMKKFLVVHHASRSAREMMAGATPEQMKKGMDAWRAWAGKLEGVVVEFGAPLEPAGRVGPATGAASDVVGYSIYQAESADALRQAIQDHPHLHSPGGWLEVLEFLPMAGM